MNKIYLCGKMSDIKDFNRPRFNFVANNLRRTGADVFNPAEIKGKQHWGWTEYMREALKGMMFCDELYVLDGWETSRGAKIEIELAKKLSMPIKYE